MNRRAYVSVILLALSFLYALPQKRYLVQTYNTKDGLLNNTVFSINQDRFGYLWFATDEGVSRFDGYQFNNSVVPAINKNTAFVEYIEKDIHGNLILTSFMQGFHIQQPDGSFKQYFFQPKRIGANLPNMLKACPDGKLLVAQSRELYIFENNKTRKIYDCGSNKNVISTLETDKYGNIWFGGIHGIGYFLKKDTVYTPVYLTEMSNNYGVNILFDKDGNLLVATKQGFYKVIIRGNPAFKLNYTISQPINELKNTFINHIYLDRQNYTWISTSSHGVFKIKNDSILENITAENGLPDDAVFCTFQDSEGNYWFSSGSGASVISNFDKYSFSYKDKSIIGAMTMVKDKYNRYWLWNGTDLLIMQQNHIEKLELKNTPIFDGGIRYLLLSKSGLVWFFNHNGMYSIPLEKGTVKLDKLKQIVDFIKLGANRFKMVSEDSAGNLWLGFENGLYLYKNNQMQPCKINIADAWKLRPFKFVQDKYGYYWLGDFNYGLYRMKLIRNKNGQAEFDSVKTFKSLKPDSSFVTAWVQDLLFDHQGNLWLSTLYTGVYKLAINKTGVAGAKLYAVKNGLSSNNVPKIIEDNTQKVWLITQHGVDVINNKDKSADSIIHYNQYNGLGAEALNVLPDGNSVYFCFTEGVYSVDLTKQKKYTKILPKVLISGINVMGTADSAALSAKGMYKLPYNRNFISFDFVTISFNRQKSILYQYMLEGLEKNWSEPTDRRYVSYNSLAPGKYIFKVRAKSVDGLENKEITSYSFVIVPPFYRTWWFILFSIVVVSLLIYTAYNYRIKQLLKLERLRTRIASDLHDDIGSTLSSISILSDILSTQLDNNPKSVEMVGKIGHNARNMLDSMDDIIWAVNPANDKFQNLGLRISEYAIPLFESKSIRFKIKTPGGLAMLHLSMEMRRNVYLIAKEAINNLVKYSECSEAEIEFSESHSMLQMTICDNGKGFDKLLPSNRNGLNNMKRRAEQIKAILELNSVPGEGTCIKLQVKII